MRGPFSRERLLEFVTTGYFSERLPVCKVTEARPPSANDLWLPLGQALSENSIQSQSAHALESQTASQVPPQQQRDAQVTPSQHSRFGFAADDIQVQLPPSGSADTESASDPIFMDPAVKHAVVKAQRRCLWVVCPSAT